MLTAAQPTNDQLVGHRGQLQRVKATLPQQLGCTNQLPCL